jgi:hypothetical protein
MSAHLILINNISTQIKKIGELLAHFVRKRGTVIRPRTNRNKS